MDRRLNVRKHLNPNQTTEIQLKLSQAVPTRIYLVNKLKRTRIEIAQNENCDGSHPLVTITLRKAEMIKFRRFRRLVWRDKGNDTVVQ